MPPQILVTGATGFVGRRLTSRLVAEHGPEAVTCLVYARANTDAERAGRAVLAELGVRCVPVDLVTAAGLEYAPGGPDLVFHLASNIDTGARDHRIDDLGTRNLLEAIGPLVRGSRFVFTSSIAVADHREPRDTPATEDATLARPYNEYGRRKLLAESYLRERAAAQGFGLVIARLCAVYGKGTRATGIFGQIDTMTRRGSLVARLDYPGTVSLMHVDDMVEILLRLAREPIAPGATRIAMPAAEVLTVGELIALTHLRHGKPYHPLRMPKLFWHFCRRAAYALFRLEPLLPHAASNKAWQLGLTVTDTLHFDAAATAIDYPDMSFRRFSDSLDEI